MATLEQKADEYEAQVMSHSIDQEKVSHIKNLWEHDPRWTGVTRHYSVEDVLRARGTLRIEYSFAQAGAARLWKLLQTEDYIHALGALTGNMAIQQVEAGLKAIYLSGWQVAADGNLADEMYPDQSLYPANSVPAVVKRINNALRRADQIQVQDGRKNGPYWFAPIVADGEAGFGGPLNVFELMRQMIEAGAAGVHFEDQLSSAKKCSHTGGKVLVPTQEFITKLNAARFAADVCGVPTMVIARTDADAATLLTTDADERDRSFIESDKRTSEGFYRIRNGIESAIARGLSYAPHCDMIWCETSVPDLEQAKKFAEAIQAEYPDKLLSYNCSPSFNWKRSLSESQISTFHLELAAMGYKFQFVTLAGFHALNMGMFNLARQFRDRGMAAYSEFQEEEFRHEKEAGYMATSHQSFVGAGYFDRIINNVTEGGSDLRSMPGSTEESQF